MSTESVTPDAGGDAARIAELEAEVARLQGKLQTQPVDSAPSARGSKWRTFWAVVCITIACLLANTLKAACLRRGLTPKDWL